MISHVEFYWRDGSWRRLGEWVWEIERPYCGNGCIILWVGFFIVAIYRNGCQKGLP